MTLEKGIHYAGLPGNSQNAETPAPLLSQIQLKSIATAFIARHFPGYRRGMFEIDAPPLDPTDENAYYVSFCCLAASGAEQPLQGLVIVGEKTGIVLAYDEKSIPVMIITYPALRQAQALHAGRNWLAQNVSTDPSARRRSADRPSLPRIRSTSGQAT